MVNGRAKHALLSNSMQYLKVRCVLCRQYSWENVCLAKLNVSCRLIYGISSTVCVMFVIHKIHLMKLTEEYYNIVCITFMA